MKGADDRRDFGLALFGLCWLKDWDRATLSQESGVDKDLISDYWHGNKNPTRKTRERLAAALGVTYSFIEQLLPVCRGIRLAYEAAAKGGPAAPPPAVESAPRLEEKIAAAAREAMAPFLLELSQLDARPGPRAEDRSWAEAQWTALEPLPAEDQSRFAEVLQGDERSWALAVRLCEASTAAAAHGAAEAVRLARLALRIAEAAPGAQWRLRLLGHCEPFLANALKVGGDLPAARETFARADGHWAQGEGGDPAGLLDGSRRLDLKASLLQYDGQFEEALALLEQALQSAGTDQARGRLLIKKAVCQEIAGEYEAALEVLGQAEPLIEGERDPRLLFACLFNRAVLACHLDLYEEEAEALLPRVEALAADLHTELDGVRTLWLRGRTWAGLGRREEAIAALSQVRRYFQSKEIAYDFALVTLELATLYLEQGRTRLVKELAEELVWIFKGQKVHQEALAALALFRQAAREEEAETEWTRRLVKYLYRAQHNPNLRFEP